MGGSLADSSLTYSKLCLVYMTPTLYLDSSSSRQSSSQDFWGSQVPGLGWGLSKPMPPVNRNLHSSSATCFSCLSRFTQSTKENRSCVCVCVCACVCRMHQIRTNQVNESLTDHGQFTQVCNYCNNTLSFSKSDRHTLQYREYVKCVMRLPSRVSNTSDCSALSIDITNKFTNLYKE